MLCGAPDNLEASAKPYEAMRHGCVRCASQQNDTKVYDKDGVWNRVSCAYGLG
jgi:hypothetical protein